MFSVDSPPKSVDNNILLYNTQNIRKLLVNFYKTTEPHSCTNPRSNNNNNICEYPIMRIVVNTCSIIFL